MNRLEYYMYNFNVMELKKYLGNNLADLLIEWIPEGEQVFSEENLIQMILSVYGNKILDNYDFRIRLLKAFEPQRIVDYNVLIPGCEGETDASILIEHISRAPWEKRDILQIFG